MRKWIDLFEGTLPPLPSAEQTPWWIEPLAPLTAKVQSYLGVEDPWATGGCFAFAEALQSIYGGTRWGAYSIGENYDEDEDDWDHEHEVVEINGTFYDYHGVFELEKYRQLLIATHGWDDDLPMKMIAGETYVDTVPAHLVDALLHIMRTAASR